MLPSLIYADFSLTGSTSFTGSSGVALSISDLQISGTGTEPIPIKLYTTSGTLSMSTTTGLTFDGSTSGSAIYFSGTKANINSALATLTYTKTRAGTDTLEVSLVSRGQVFYPTNGHLYQFVSTGQTWANAKTAASGMTAYGASGYLATITSSGENNFVYARISGDGWLAATDQSVEKTWVWDAGPESGTNFFTENPSGGGGTAVSGRYNAWASGEPNDYGSGEDCGYMYASANGTWNDYPCNTSQGYVVEFGDVGNLPSVASKDISLTIYNPTVSSFSPSDNATDVALASNLSITFNENVTIGTGNILIKKSSDDSTLQTIDVTSGIVTGGGGSTITINPSSDLPNGTGVYVTIPSTAFHDGSSHYYAGVSSSSTWNFTTIDTISPVISSISTSSVTDTGVTITWTTDEAASTRLNYGLTTSYGTTTSETDTSPRVTSHSRTISSLVACTTYHYTVNSRDSSSNSATSSDQTFTTTGCTASATPSTTTSSSITSASGGTTSLNENGTEITVNAPSNFTDDASTVVIQVKSLPNTAILSSLGRPSNVPNEVGNIVFDVKAIINSTTILDSFDASVTISYQYADSDLNGLDESSLWLYHYHNGAWTALSSCTVNTGTNTITCTTDSFSIFGLFGRQQASSGSSESSSTPCSKSPLKEISDLFQIDVSDTQAKLFFTPINGKTSNYYISYGYAPGEERFGVFTGFGTSNGVLSYTVNHLRPSSVYYFKVRPHTECASGNWSNEMNITTGKNKAKDTKYYKNFISRLMSFFPKQTTVLGTSIAKNLKKAQVSRTCEYTVKQGDTLWKIAISQLKSGAKYNQIIEENHLNSPVLHIGQVLNIGC